MILTTILGPSGLLLAVGSVAAYAVLGRKRSKSGGTPKPSTTSTTRPPPPPPSPSPLVVGSNCTEVADEAEIMRWIREVVAPVLLQRIDAYDVPLDDHEQARRTVEEIVDEVFATTVPQCKGYATRATRLVWKTLWCEVVMQLVLRGKIDEELVDVLSLCLDPSFDPRATPHIEHDEPILELPAPVMQPPWQPSEPVPPMDAREGEPPPNVWVASSRQELSQIGVMRMMEGTAAGMPIMGPAAHLVMLGFNPAWAGVEQARADMAARAAENPGLSFVEVSFADTQRHFGKPRDVNGNAWALTAAAPDGRVFSEPLALHDHDEPPPSAEQWTKVIAHASGFVGQRSVQRIARPRRFGDLTRSLVRAHRPRKRATPAMRPRKPSTQRPPRRRG